MTTTVKFNKLSVLIERFPDYIEIIKDSYLELLSELTEVSKLDTSVFLENIQKINQMGAIIICFLENPTSLVLYMVFFPRATRYHPIEIPTENQK